MTLNRTCCAFLAAIALTLPAVAQTRSEGSRLLLIQRDGRSQVVDVVEISSSQIVHRTSDGGWMTHAISDCVALVETEGSSRLVRGGVLEMTDGQRLPGSVVSDAGANPEHFAWDHVWLGRVEIPLDRISRVLLQPSAVIPGGARSDVIVLTNGDVLEGFVARLGNPLVLEVDHEGNHSPIEIGLNRVAAVSMVAPTRPPTGWRVWFRDGTVIDVSSLRVGDDRFLRLRWPLMSGLPPENRTLDSVAGILFTPNAMTPLASLSPTRVSGPPYRYKVPQPRVLDADSPLRLSRVEFRGPLVAHYELPHRSTRLVCEATLPYSSREWGDVELIVRCDNIEVGRFHLNSEHPTVAVNVPLPGAELTIELGEGRRGPIQDQIELHRAMILRAAD